MSAARRTVGDVVLVAAGLAAMVALAGAARTAPGLIIGTALAVIGTCAALLVWDLICDALDGRGAGDARQERAAGQQWTPEDAREFRFTPPPFRDPWADDPDRTTRRETWE